MGKFNVVLDCFCGRPTRTLVDSMRRNPDVRPVGTVLCGVCENTDVIPLKSVPFRGGSGPHLIHSSLGQPESTFQTDRFSRFCKVHGRYRQTNRQSDRPRYSVSCNRPHLASATMRPKTRLSSTTSLWVNSSLPIYTVAGSLFACTSTSFTQSFDATAPNQLRAKRIKFRCNF